MVWALLTFAQKDIAGSIDVLNFHDSLVLLGNLCLQGLNDFMHFADHAVGLGGFL